jgi:hypothetical protein
MRLFTSCMQCSSARLDAGQLTNDLPGYLLDLSVDGVYINKCRDGHPMRMVLQNLQYELLFESGIMALLSGFHLQAVSSAATALERFFEFAIRVFLIHAEATPENVDAAWKMVAASSERQYGAFLFLYLATMKKPYARENQKMVEGRNRVVHRGEIPTPEKAREFAEYVYEIAHHVRAELVKLDANAVQRAEWHAYRRAHDLLDQKDPPNPDATGRDWRGGGGSQYEMMLKSINADPLTDFEGRLREAKDRMSFWGLRLPPPDERVETSRLGSFLVTEYGFTRAYFLEGPAEARDGAPVLRADLPPEELEAIRQIPEKADRATAIGEFIKTKGVPIPETK